MKKFTFEVMMILFLLSSNHIFSYNWLYVRDPRGWNGGQGTIEEAVLTARPQGLYMEYNLYLTFSARNLYLSNNDTLEVQFDFDLPQNAIVTDMWLWIGKDIMKALIFDKWTASNIYENIVKRRRDPAILTKLYQDSYELRVYPMPAKEQRKVKITYLVPVSWQLNSVSAPLPVNLLNTSLNPLSKLSLIVWQDEVWGKPSIAEKPDMLFSAKYDSAKGNYFEAQIQNSDFYSLLNLSFCSPMKNGIYVNKYENGLEGYYQLALMPSKILDFKHNKKVAFLLDCTASNSSYTITDVIANIKSLITSTFSEKDSFNIILSKLDVYRKSEKWLPADAATIQSVFASLGANSIASYSNLAALLNNGIDFVKKNGNDGEILLVSNSGQYGGYESANQLTQDLLKGMNPLIKINIADYQNQNYEYNYVNGMYYYGNEYFYTNLAKLTKGSYINCRIIYSLSDLMQNSFQSLNGTITSFDLYTSVDNGFCYGRFNINYNDQPVYLDKPLLQTGKFAGDLPLSIEMSGMYNSQPFTTSIKTNISEIHSADSNIQKAWTGNYIQSLEKKQGTNEIIGEIIDFSLSNRILSLYTAFLALEPNDTIKFCKDCYDESHIPATDVEKDDKLIPDSTAFSLKPYPNPFNSQTQIVVSLPVNFKVNEASFRIYNILGQVIKTFDLNEIGTKRSFQLMWNGKGDSGENVASGVYFFVVNSPQGTHSVKLMLLK